MIIDQTDMQTFQHKHRRYLNLQIKIEIFRKSFISLICLNFRCNYEKQIITEFFVLAELQFSAEIKIRSKSFWFNFGSGFGRTLF